MIKQYVRDAKNNPVGLLLAETRDGKVFFGYSFCHRNDVYNKPMGERIAMNRLKTFMIPERDDIREDAEMLFVPDHAVTQVHDFMARLEKAFNKVLDIDVYSSLILTRGEGFLISDGVVECSWDDSLKPKTYKAGEPISKKSVRKLGSL